MVRGIPCCRCASGAGFQGAGEAVLSCTHRRSIWYLGGGSKKTGAALRGMRHTLSQYKPVLFIELHDADEDAACHAVVDDLGYKFAPVGSKGGFPHRCRTAAD